MLQGRSIVSQSLNCIPGCCHGLYGDISFVNAVGIGLYHTAFVREKTFLAPEEGGKLTTGEQL